MQWDDKASPIEQRGVFWRPEALAEKVTFILSNREQRKGPEQSMGILGRVSRLQQKEIGG